MPDSSDSSDWEYEYHDTETEEFHVILDLTSHVQPSTIRRPPGLPPSGSSIPKNAGSAKPAEDPATAEPEEDPVLDPELADDNETIPHNTTQTTQSSTSNAARAGNSNAQPTTSESNSQPRRLQYLDLPSSNPIVSYRSRNFSCSWVTPLGTDLTFEAQPASPIPSSNPNPDPTEVDTTSRAPSTGPQVAHFSPTKQQAPVPIRSILRLVGKPIKLTPRDLSSPPLGTPSPEGRGIPQAKTYIAPVRQAQADFLMKFAALKAAKGETDAVPFESRKGRGPRRRQEWREGSSVLAQDEDEEMGDEWDGEDDGEGVGEDDGDAVMAEDGEQG